MHPRLTDKCMNVSSAGFLLKMVLYHFKLIRITCYCQVTDENVDIKYSQLTRTDRQEHRTYP